MGIGIVVLAAGNSVRYQGIKLLDNVDGKKMYRHILDKVRKLANEPKIVVTQYEEIAAYAVKSGCNVVINERPEDGLSGSIKLGIMEALAKEPKLEGILFAVSDQPYLHQETIERVITAFYESKKGIVSAAKDGMSGNPCLFGCRYFQELLCLTGDKGGKIVIKNHENDVYFLQVEDEKELEDIDLRKK